MKFVVGLGNPGIEYHSTRHNAGYLFIDYIHESIKQELKINKKKRYYFYQWKDLIFIKPMTFMNLSGLCISSLKSDFNEFLLKDLIVVYDDIDLEFGVIRFRKSGGSGTHNGLKSIISELGHQNFARIRIGIGPKPEHGDLADFVLSNFQEEEKKELPTIFKKSYEGLFLWKQGRIEQAMNVLNQKPKPTLV